MTDMSSDIYYAMVNGEEFQVEILSDSEVAINGKSYKIDFESLKLGSSCSLLIDGSSYEPSAYQENGGWEILVKGRRFSVQVEDEIERKLRLAAGSSPAIQGQVIIQSPMPGLVIDIPVQEGEEVSEGQVLVILESMKMQNELTAPRDGVVARVQAEVNDNVERKETLLILD